MCGGGAECRRQTASGSRGRTQAEVQRSDLSRGGIRWARGVDCICAERTHVQIQANKLIQEVAPIVAARAAGDRRARKAPEKTRSKIGEALARARELISL